MPQQNKEIVQKMKNIVDKLVEENVEVECKLKETIRNAAIRKSLQSPIALPDHEHPCVPCDPPDMMVRKCKRINCTIIA